MSTGPKAVQHKPAKMILKAPLVPHTERPVMGLHIDRDCVYTNALGTIRCARIARLLCIQRSTPCREADGWYLMDIVSYGVSTSLACLQLTTGEVEYFLCVKCGSLLQDAPATSQAPGSSLHSEARLWQGSRLPTAQQG